MKVRNSPTSMKNMHGSQLVRWCGRVFVINKLDSRFTAPQD